MSKKLTIHLPEDVFELLSDSKGLSGRVTSIVRRYFAISRESVPNLTRNEWCALCDANNGLDDALMGDAAESVGMMLIANLQDAPELGNKWDVSIPLLVSKLSGMDTAKRTAAYEVVVAFWKNVDIPTDEALAKAGVRFK